MRYAAKSRNSAHSLAALAAVALAYSGIALGGTVAAGGQLTLGDSYTQASPTSIATSAAANNDLTMNPAGGSFTYANGFGGPQAAITAAGAAANTGFYDDYVFTITGSLADSITATVSLGGSGTGSAVTQISNLSAQLFSVTGNPNLPSFAPANSVSDTLTVQNYTFAPGVTSTEVILDSNAPLAAGTYVLEVTGWATGTSGGSYSGVLNVTPVPLPASFPLFLVGLGGLGASLTCRRQAAGVSAPPASELSVA